MSKIKKVSTITISAQYDVDVQVSYYLAKIFYQTEIIITKMGHFKEQNIDSQFIELNEPNREICEILDLNWLIYLYIFNRR